MEDLVIPSDALIDEPPMRDPAKIGYPPNLAVELALGEHKPRALCEAYGIDEAEWDRLRSNPLFVADVEARLIELQADGVSFKMKARLQAEGMLAENWRLVHDKNTPQNVKADLIKHTVRMAGLDSSKDQTGAALGTAVGAALQITLNLG